MRMIGFFSCKSSLKKWISLLLTAALLFTGCIGFAQSARATSGSHIVTLPAGEGYSLTDANGTPLASGEHDVADGGDFSFKVVLAEGYESAGVTVSANGKTIQASSGVYALNGVTEDISVSIAGVTANQPTSYKASLQKNDEKFTIAIADDVDPQAIVQGGSLTFTLTPNAAYAGVQPVVKANGQKLSGSEKNGVWTYTIADIRCDIAITVNDKDWTANATTYTITLPTGEGFAVTQVTGGVDKGEGKYIVNPNGGITFKVDVQNGYDAGKLVVKANNLVMKPNSKGVYAISKINCDVTVSVTVPKIANYQYIVSLPSGNGFEVKDISGGVDLGDMCFGVNANGGVTFKVDVKKGYDAEKLVVKANNLVMKPNSKGVYAISKINCDVAVSVTVPKTPGYQYIVSLPSGEGFAVKDVTGGVDLGSLRFGVNPNGSVTFKMDVKKGFHADWLVVKANGKVITANDKGIYALQNIQEDIQVTAGFSQRQSVKFTLTDEATRVRVSGYSYTTPKLVVEKISSGSSAYKSLRANASGLDVLGAYDVNLLNAELDGKITVSFRVGDSLNGQKVRVLYLVDGKVIKRAITVKSGRAALTVDEPAIFMVAGPMKEVLNPPNTGSDNTYSQMGWTMLACASLLCLAIKKRKMSGIQSN